MEIVWKEDSESSPCEKDDHEFGTDGLFVAEERVKDAPSLQEMCVRMLVEEAKTFRGWTEIAERAEFLQTDQCKPILTIIHQQAFSYFPLLRTKHPMEELKAMFCWIDWDAIQKTLDEIELTKTRFVQMKGEVLERPVVPFDPNAKTFPYAALKAGVAWPLAVDPTKREDFLSDDDFVGIFKMTRADFKALPKFKRDNLKKDTKLF
jgi:hypothetical protein